MALPDVWPLNRRLNTIHDHAVQLALQGKRFEAMAEKAMTGDQLEEAHEMMVRLREEIARWQALGAAAEMRAYAKEQFSDADLDFEAEVTNVVAKAKAVSDWIDENAGKQGARRPPKRRAELVGLKQLCKRLKETRGKNPRT